MPGKPLTMQERHTLHRVALYDAAVQCLTLGCDHKDKVACTEAWFNAMRAAGPRRTPRSK